MATEVLERSESTIEVEIALARGHAEALEEVLHMWTQGTVEQSTEGFQRDYGVFTNPG